MVFAQGTTSRLLGTVQDSSGAVISGAAVQLTNEGTGISFKAVTTDAGTYVFEAVQSGDYTVAVEAKGFRKFVARGNRVSIGQPTTVNVKLDVGAVAETVEVSAVAEMVQTSSSGNLGNLMTEKVLRDLPLVGTRGRNPLNFTAYMPGVVSGANTGGGSHVNGARDRAWNYTLDGIDMNETSAGGSELTPARVNPDMLAEFRVITSNFTADSGRNSGAQVAMVTKSGTNEIHGNAFEFYRTPRFNANEWENPVNGVDKRQFVQHTYGGSVGGPIVKNKLFYFVNLQRLYALNTAPITRTVYTATARQGLWRYVSGGRNFPAGTATPSVDFAGNPVAGLNIQQYNIAASDPQRLGIDKTIAGLVSAQPLPNRFDVGDGLNTGGFTFNAAQRERQYDLTWKVDYNINAKNTAFARMYIGRQDSYCDQANGGTEIFPGQTCLVNTFRNPKNYAYNWRYTPNGAMTNEFVVGWNQFKFDFDQPLSSLTDVSLTGTPVTVAADRSFGNVREIRTLQFVDNFSWLKGPHAFKFGANMRYQTHQDWRGSVAGLNAAREVTFSTTQNPVDPTAFGLPSAINQNFDRVALENNINFLLGRVGRMQRGFVSNGSTFVPGRFEFQTRYDEYDFYLQDTWKLKPNFTIDLGLRFESKMPPKATGGRDILVPDQPIVAGGTPTNTVKWVPGDLWKKNLNLAPSIGFAWDPFGNGKTSIRSNYRIAYDRLNTFSLSSTIYNSTPGYALAVINDAYGQSGGRLASLPALNPPSTDPNSLRQPAAFSNASQTVVDPNFKMPTTHQWAFSVQREIAKATVLEVSYIGRRAYHLFGAYNVNQVDVFGKQLVAAFNTVKAGGESALINSLASADSRLQAGETPSRMIRRLFPGQLNLNSVGEIAQSLATRIQGTQSVTALSGAGPFALASFPQFLGGVNVIDSNDFSTYHGLTLQLDRRLSQGLSVQGSYTLSKSLDTRSFDPAFTIAATANSQSAGGTPFDIYNRKLNYAPSDFDRTHNFQSNFVYELPFGKSRKFGSSAGPVVNRIIGGWQVAGLFRVSSGRPFSVYSGANTFNGVVQSFANCSGCTRADGAVFDDASSGFKWYFDSAQRGKFTTPVAGELGNTGRNYFRGDRFWNMDASFAKRIEIRERMNLEIRADCSNLTNSPSFGAPTATVTSTIFGRIRDTVTSGSRKITMGAKFNF